MNRRWKTTLKVSNKPKFESENSMKYVFFIFPVSQLQTEFT